MDGMETKTNLINSKGNTHSFSGEKTPSHFFMPCPSACEIALRFIGQQDYHRFNKMLPLPVELHNTSSRPSARNPQRLGSPLSILPPKSLLLVTATEMTRGSAPNQN